MNEIVPKRSDLEQMCREHFNEPMLSMFDVVRCVGYGESADDCYVIVREPHYPEGKLRWLTCVGGYTFLDRLRGQGYVKSSDGEDWDDLVRLDSTLALNGAPKEAGFILDLRPDEHETFDISAAIATPEE
jgi:hypothetical protein